MPPPRRDDKKHTNPVPARVRGRHAEAFGVRRLTAHGSPGIRRAARILAAAATAAWALWGPGPGRAATPLTVLYIHRPPYYQTEPDGSAGGALVEIARLVFQRAGIPHRFVRMPPRRVLHAIRQGEPVCSVGWFRTRERETFARFSDPIYQNLPPGALVRRPAANRWPARPTLEQAMRSGLVLGVVKGYRYGPPVERLLARLRPRTVRVAGGQENLLRMVARGRVDWMLICPEEAGYRFRTDPDLAARTVFVRFRDAPPGNHRYIMFSRSVPTEVIRAVNRAIRAVRSSARYRRIVERLRAVEQEGP